ncbi:unnamed protein product [Brachionus calyciflorus]|uniref:Uncharacterized protein n=1 Tax=Brachionus calyciflorus TaxID=104777 RepID=A0A813N997_9BILA|nr:unnamed protein product [Brachionus calyciflorus]
MENKIELPNLKDALKCTVSEQVTTNLEELLGRLRNGYYDYVCSAQEYIEYDKFESTGEVLTDADIVELVKKPDETENE